MRPASNTKTFSASKTVEKRWEMRTVVRLEPGQAIRIGGERLGEDLQGHLALELRIGGLADLSHAAFADLGGDFVVPEARADVERHELSWNDQRRSRGHSSPLARPGG